MVHEYYELAKSYLNQDALVLLAFVFAGLVALGWRLIQRFNYRWLEIIYAGEMLLLWAGLLIYFPNPAG